MNLMKKKLNKKGFTLAELLIVVAIIAVLTAIAIPVFTSQLNKAKIQTDHANIRGAYAQMRTAELTGEVNGNKLGDTGVALEYYYMADGTLADSSSTKDKCELVGNENPCSLEILSLTNHAPKSTIKITFAADATNGGYIGTLTLVAAPTTP